MTTPTRSFWRRLAQAATAPTTAGTTVTAPAGLASAMRPLALEQRFMFDGAAVDAAADAAHAASAAAAAAVAADGGGHDAAAALWVPQAVEVRAAQPARDGGKKEVVLVDTSLADYKTLEAGVRDGVGIVEFDGSADGLAQIAAWAASQSGLDAIHIFSHGNDGQLHLGSTTLTDASLSSTQVQAQLAQLGRALQADGDVLLYGCDLAQTQAGQHFIQQLAQVTGADVAASSDATGSALRGGDWVLEYNAGTLEASALAASAYQSVLATTTFDFENVLDNYQNPDIILTHTISQTSGSYTLIITARDADLAVSTEDNYPLSSDASGKMLFTGAFGIVPETQLILSLSGGKIFDLSAFTLASLDGQFFGLRLATSKGAETFPFVLNENGSWSFSLANAAHPEYFTGVTSVTITRADGQGFYVGLDNIALSNITNPNQAPVASLTATNPTYTESAAAVQLFSGATVSTGEAGQLVQQMTFTVSGVANGVAEKLVIDGTDVTLTNGTSVTTTTNGTAVTVSVTGDTATVTLGKAAGLSVATAQTILTTMTYRNDSENPNTANRVVTLTSVKDSGGTAGGGVDTQTLNAFSTVTVVGVNDAPTLSGGPFLLTSTDEDTTSTGVRISTVLADLTYSDPDSGVLLGAAVTATTGNGTWQFSLNGVSGWTGFGTVSNSSALLLTGNTYVRYVPNGANGEAATFTLRAWDQTSGTASSASTPRTGDTSIAGGSSAYSSGTAAASIIVTNANDAPELTAGSPTLPGLTDSQINNVGVLVSQLYSTNFTDVDNSASKGIAITGLNRGNGNWQFSIDGGTSWDNLGIVGVNSALLLRSTDRVRFVPDGLNGTTADFTFRAWDQTGITNGMHGTKAVASSVGGITPFSVGLDTASITVTAANDAPTLTDSGGSAAFVEGNKVTSTPVAIDPGLTLSDLDSPTLSSAKVLISGNFHAGEDSLGFSPNAATMGDISGIYNAGTGTLTLTSSGGATVGQWRAALRSVTYTNSSDTPNVSSRTISFSISDGTNESSTVTRPVTITAVDDDPVITAPTSITVVEDVASVLSNISISDPDSVNIVMTLSVTSGTLGAIGGSGVAVGGTATAMTLSGTIANVNAFISNNRVTYTTAANATADATLTVLVDTGSAGTDTKTITLAATPVNDAPVVSVPVSLTVTEDVPGGVTNISFSDVDAGNASVTATFSVPSGVLRAVSGSGVTVDGSGTGTLTLSGSLSDINTFIAATRVSFQTALNSTDSLLLTVSINDNGNTGGSAQTDSKTVTINVTAVNDAPVNSVPGAQTIKQNEVLAFNTLKGNAISFSDPDAGSSNVIVILNSVNGTMSLTAAGGVTFVTGDGVDDTSMRMQGTQADLNTTLQSLTFKPTTGFLGNAQMSIQTNDMGFSGSGGAKTDFDLILITVVPANPAVTSVSAQGLDRAVKIGDEVLINMVFDQTMNVDVSGGTPSLLLETGLLDRSAVYLSGSGSNTLVFKYIVQAGDTSADLDFQSTVALQLNNAVLTNTTGDVAILTLPTVGGADSLGGRSNIVVDGVVPVVTSVGMPSDGTYIVGQNLDFTVSFSENVVVDTIGGIPRIAVTLDTGGTVYAQYASGSGSSALVFRLVVASGQLDSTGVTLGSSLDPNGGSIRDAAGNNSVTALNNVASPADVKVDGVAPTVVSVGTPANGGYNAGDVLTFTVNASEALQTGGLPPRLVLDVGGATRYATYVSGSGSAALVFQYTVQPGDNDSDGIAVGSLDLRGEQLTDLAGNNLNLTLNGLGSTAGVVVDTIAPTASLSLDKTSLNAQQTAVLTVRFNEAVTGLDVADFTVVDGVLSGLSSADGGITWTATLTPVVGKVQVGIHVTLNNAGYTDLAGNAGANSSLSGSYAINTVLPAQPVLQVESNVAGNATVRVDALEAGAPWEYSLDGGQSWQAGQGNVVAIASPGLYNVQVRQTNAAGNVSEAGLLTVDVAPLVVPPSAEWPVMGVLTLAGAHTDVWGASLAPVVFAPFGFAGNPALVPRGSGDFLVGSGSAAPAGTMFFSGGVATVHSELSLGFLGEGGIGDSRVIGASALAGMFAPPATTIDRLVLLQPAEAVVVAAGRQVDWKVPPTMFGHSDPLASLQFSMTQASGQPLPAWLAFDARTGRVSGEPPSSFKGELTLRLTVRDNQGNVVSTVITFKAADAGAAPRAGVAEQLQRHAQLRAGQMAAQRLHL